jgi:acetyl esterase/lipase
MMDKELRGPAILGRFIMLPWPWHFRMMAGLSKLARGQHIEGLTYEEVLIPRSSERSHIRTCIYRRPAGNKPVPALLYLHAGGYAIGTPEGFGSLIRRFIDARDCVVIAPDYRKSLEAPYPAAIDDCYDTLLWIKNNAKALGVRSDQIMVGGHSAGGGLTAAVTLRARDRGDVNIAFQMPIYPMLDDRQESASARDNNAPLWNSKLNAMAWNFYLSDLKTRRQPIPYDAAPARAGNYANLPPTMTYVGAGVPVEFVEFKGCFHGFDIFVPGASVSKQATEFAMTCFAKAVDTCFAPQGAPTASKESIYES